MTKYLTIIAILIIIISANLKAEDYLSKCYEKQVKQLNKSTAVFNYNTVIHRFYHSPEPWQTITNTSYGVVWINTSTFANSDTIKRTDNVITSIVFKNDSVLLAQPYWSKEILKTTKSILSDKIFDIINFSPSMLIDYFSKAKPNHSQTVTAMAIYSLELNKKMVKMYINKKNNLLSQVSVTYHDDILGDVTNNYQYSNYTNQGDLYFPQTVIIEKLQNVKDTINISFAKFSDTIPELLKKPDNYKVEEDETIVPEVSVEKISDRIYTVNLPHTKAKSMLVEFKDHFVAIEAPLASENGEMIINEAKKLNPDKPIKSFFFGHHHPWYIGGVRAFIHNGTTIYTRKEILPFLEFIANAPHTLKPDILHKKPKPLKTEFVDSAMTVSDGEYEFKVYHIGNKTQHANDYLVFYFPKEKILFEGDLVFIKKDEPIKKANVRQVGMYNAIKDLGIDVQRIIQSWPIGPNSKFKTDFPFSELEESVNMK